MKKLLNFGLALVVMLCALQACEMAGTGDSAPKDGYEVSGKLENVQANTKVFLEVLDSKKINIIDTTAVDDEGMYKFTGKIPAKSIGRLRIGMGSNATMFILDNEKTTINADLRNMAGSEIIGSKENAIMGNLTQAIISRQATPDYLKNFVDTVSSPLVAYVAINYLKIEDEYETYKKLAGRLSKEMPNSKLTSDFLTYVNSMKNIANISVGKTPPDIKLPSPEGKEIPLSSLKGKIVLVDFWASWCRPCRRENPNVVRAYKEYKSKGFEVYSVSLDKSKDKWVKAIKDDNLIWDSHVSDLGGWQSSAAAMYNIKSIPQTLLLDKEGKIIAKNLRGAALDNKLKELFGA